MPLCLFVYMSADLRQHTCLPEMRAKQRPHARPNFSRGMNSAQRLEGNRLCAADLVTSWELKHAISHMYSHMCISVNPYVYL